MIKRQTVKTITIGITTAALAGLIAGCANKSTDSSKAGTKANQDSSQNGCSATGACGSCNSVNSSKNHGCGANK